MRAANSLVHYTMHSFRVGSSVSKSPGRAAVVEILKNWGWKTEQVARYYIGATVRASAGATGHKAGRGFEWKRESDHATAQELPLSPAFQKLFATCHSRYTRGTGSSGERTNPS